MFIFYSTFLSGSKGRKEVARQKHFTKSIFHYTVIYYTIVNKDFFCSFFVCPVLSIIQFNFVHKNIFNYEYTLTWCLTQQVLCKNQSVLLQKGTLVYYSWHYNYSVIHLWCSLSVQKVFLNEMKTTLCSDVMCYICLSNKTNFWNRNLGPKVKFLCLYAGN